MPTETDFAKALMVLKEGDVEFIIVGGVAAILNGLGYTTYDLDVVYSRERANIQKLVRCLEPYSPYLRGAPPGLPFKLDERTVRMGLNFTLVTAFGDLDLLGEVTAIGGYRELLYQDAANSAAPSRLTGHRRRAQTAPRGEGWLN